MVNLNGPCWREYVKFAAALPDKVSNCIGAAFQMKDDETVTNGSEIVHLTLQAHIRIYLYLYIHTQTQNINIMVCGVARIILYTIRKKYQTSEMDMGLLLTNYLSFGKPVDKPCDVNHSQSW